MTKKHKALLPSSKSSSSQLKPSLAQLQKTSENEINDIFNKKTTLKPPTSSLKKEVKKLHQNKNAPKETTTTGPPLITKENKDSPSVLVTDLTEITKRVETKLKRPFPSSEKFSKLESKDEFLGKNTTKKRLTEEGYRVYCLEDLVSQTGGNTPSCPFDCECCY
ncbi:hypothetical protein HMI54_002375 [Coelomomyces lativittatus]|nr:hypothetical protein HMI54_002375 [Coelomomyces lativittatus]KAJ1510199.1 hypothetical protein HMI56_006450 [Coelomomyces lativittatus]KAJ1511964.1 hypothetical protein HMI55_006404 [Coelomomyces lativittatus]